MLIHLLFYLYNCLLHICLLLDKCLCADIYINWDNVILACRQAFSYTCWCTSVSVMGGCWEEVKLTFFLEVEMYIGGMVNDWKCGLVNKQSKSLQMLHAKYFTTILYSSENKFVDAVMTTASGNKPHSGGTKEGTYWCWKDGRRVD